MPVIQLTYPGLGIGGRIDASTLCFSIAIVPGEEDALRARAPRTGRAERTALRQRERVPRRRRTASGCASHGTRRHDRRPDHARSGPLLIPPPCVRRGCGTIRRILARNARSPSSRPQRSNPSSSFVEVARDPDALRPIRTAAGSETGVLGDDRPARRGRGGAPQPTRPGWRTATQASSPSMSSAEDLDHALERHVPRTSFVAGSSAQSSVGPAPHRSPSSNRNGSPSTSIVPRSRGLSPATRMIGVRVAADPGRARAPLDLEVHVLADVDGDLAGDSAGSRVDLRASRSAFSSAQTTPSSPRGQATEVARRTPSIVARSPGRRASR